MHWTRPGKRRALTRREVPMGDKHRTTCRGRSSTLRSGRVLILDTAERVSQNQHSSDTSPPRGKKKEKKPLLATFCATTFINLALCAHSRPCSPSVGADGGATRGPGERTGWMAHDVTLRRDLSVSISRLAPPVQPVQHIYLRYAAAALLILLLQRTVR